MQFQNTDNRSYRERILNAFPTALKQDVEQVIEVLPLDNHNVLLSYGQIHNVDNLIYPYYQSLILGNEELKIPYRIYFNEPNDNKEKILTDIQRTILNCIYLRHCDGYLRQRRLESLVDKTEYFVIPFVFQLLGEYVIEILDVLDKHINPSTIDNYTKFISENPKYWQQTESRMVSYWNEYYRRPIYPNCSSPKTAKRKEYIGQIIVDRLKKRTHNRSIYQ